MKLLHTADLHLGKRVNGFSMIEDQAYILQQILQIAEAQAVDAVLIAGDVYDRTVPSEEAVELFDGFLAALSQYGIPVFVISGNHDSAERMAFGNSVMSAGGIYLSPVYRGSIAPILLEDTHGPVAFWLVPFVKPAHVRAQFPEEEISSYEDAMRVVLSHLEIDPAIRNVALVHQFLTGGATCDSELHTVGGTEEISAALFDIFDYVALGHLHGAQKITRETLRYAGSPLKYSFSEANQKKSVSLITLGEKGSCTVDLLPLTARHDLCRIRGPFEELTQSSCGSDDYCEITLTDEQDIPDAVSRLRVFYPNLMLLRYDNQRTRTQSIGIASDDIAYKTPLQLFDELYKLQNGQPMEDEQRALMHRLIQELWEDET